VVKLLDELDEQIEHLKVKYERYFVGVDNVPPIKHRERVERSVRTLMREPMTSTVRRFRFASLRQRLTTYSHYWNRILNQIEKGTYKRLLSEAKRRQREMMIVAQARREALARGEPDPAAASAAAVPRTTAPTNGKPAGAKPPPAPPPLPDGMNAKEARALYKQFVTAKKAAGENTRGITYGGLVQKLAKELPRLQKKHGDSVRFEVKTVNGKVKLKARGS
jgi:hypothetical protein